MRTRTGLSLGIAAVAIVMVWARAPWLMEGGKGKKPIAVHFQLRPDPLAK